MYIFNSLYLLHSYNPSFLICLCFNMVSFRGQKKLGPRPDRSPQGFNSKFPTSIPTPFICGVPPRHFLWPPQCPYHRRMMIYVASIPPGIRQTKNHLLEVLPLNRYLLILFIFHQINFFNCNFITDFKCRHSFLIKRS